MERARAAADPNFPTGGLAISPSYGHHKQASTSTATEWAQDSEEDIQQYGIAGRVWEAAYLLQRYTSLPCRNVLEFDPPCSLVADNRRAITALELGAGAGVVGIDLAQTLHVRATDPTHPIHHHVVLTDLDNVLPLLQRNVRRAGFPRENVPSVNKAVDITIEPLPWGSTQHANRVLQKLHACGRSLTHVICSDLVYFPELLPPLLRTLIYLTQPSTGMVSASSPSSSEPQVIISYKIRSLAKEEPFWRAFGAWFNFVPVLCRRHGRTGVSKGKLDEWRRFGTWHSDMHDLSVSPDDDDESAPAEDDVFVFVAQRRAETLTCRAPVADDRLLDGWLMDTKDDTERRGNGVDTFEFILMSAMDAA